MFLGRKPELAMLEKEYRSKKSSFVPIYGRRRVGKSELILQFLRGKKGGLYFLGKTAPEAMQVTEFLREASRVVGEPLLASMDAEGWKQALLAATDRWKGPGKLVLVLDEFQWIADACPDLPSILQECWDRHWKSSGKVMLILCGSFVGFMERKVLGRKSPLFGRRSAQILLRPFGYREAAAFHPSWSLRDQAIAYFVCGGVPLYHRFFEEEQSVEANIEQNLLGEYAPLFREPDFLLREELREVENYYAILLAVSSGSATNTQIAESTGIAVRSLAYYLGQLHELGYVGKKYPLTGKKPANRHVRYTLEDALLRFWFRFVFPNLSFIQHMSPSRAFRERIRPELASYWGSCFERLCREALPRLYEREGVGAAFQIGEYWDKTTQIDVVGHRDDNWTDLGECKWGTIRSTRKVLEELEQKVTRYPNKRGATLGRGILAQERPSKAPTKTPNVRWHSLKDLYR